MISSSGHVRTVLHLFDSSTDWQHRTGARQLFERLPADRFTCLAAATDGRVRQALRPALGQVELFAPRLGALFMACPLVERAVRARHVDLIQAWGVEAALLATAGAPDVPLVVELFDPQVSPDDARRLRSLERTSSWALACGSGTVRRRWIENGIEPDRTVVLRPGVDFASINAARRQDLRGRLGLPPDARVAIAPTSGGRDGGLFAACWAVGIRSFVEPHVRLMLPGDCPERNRILRLARGLQLDHLLCCPDNDLGFDDAVAAADLLLAVPATDIPTTSLAWAMAAGVGILATAVYSIAEMIANDHNGLLLKPGAERPLAYRLAAKLDDGPRLAQVADTARAQAFQVFSLRRCIDQHVRLYENVTTGAAVDEGIVDSALDV